MGSCKWLNENKENIDLLYNESMNEDFDAVKQKNAIDLDCDLPDWLNDDFMVDHKKETIKMQIEKSKQTLKERKKEHEKIKKGVSFANINNMNNFKQNKNKNKTDENNEILDYESENETNDNAKEIHDLFNRLKNNSNLNTGSENEKIFFPLQVGIFLTNLLLVFLKFSNYLDYLCK